jgi:hypothetical protein
MEVNTKTVRSLRSTFKLYRHLALNNLLVDSMTMLRTSKSTLKDSVVLGNISKAKCQLKEKITSKALLDSQQETIDTLASNQEIYPMI